MPNSSTVATPPIIVPPGYTDQPENWFDEHIPSDFLQDTIELLFNHYAGAAKHLARFKPAERHDAWPVYRRGLIEGDWRQLALDYGLNGSTEKNVSLNHNHTVVSTGILVLTQSYVEERGYLPRPAEYRNTLTKTCQGSLFPNLESEPDPASRIYAIISHGVWANDPTQPGFADVLFPAVRGREVVVATRIRLFEDRFPGLVAQLRGAVVTVATEEIKDDLEPRFHSKEGTGE